MNRAQTEGLRKLIDIARTSGIPYKHITRRAGIGSDNTLYHWQQGRYGASLRSAECVAEALGYKLEWVKQS